MVNMKYLTLHAVSFQLRLQTTTNLREHWAVKMNRTAAQRRATFLALKLSKKPGERVNDLADRLKETNYIKFTRVAPRLLDDDNNVAAFKSIRDEVCKFIGSNDGPDCGILFEYAQRKGRPLKPEVEIEFRWSSQVD